MATKIKISNIKTSVKWPRGRCCTKECRERCSLSSLWFFSTPSDWRIQGEWDEGKEKKKIEFWGESLPDISLHFLPELVDSTQRARSSPASPHDNGPSFPESAGCWLYSLPLCPETKDSSDIPLFELSPLLTFHPENGYSSIRIDGSQRAREREKEREASYRFWTTCRDTQRPQNLRASRSFSDIPSLASHFDFDLISFFFPFFPCYFYLENTKIVSSPGKILTLKHT